MLSTINPKAYLPRQLLYLTRFRIFVKSLSEVIFGGDRL
jgi:hypothetical protein